MAKPPIQKPTPLMVNRPFAQPISPKEKRPLTTKLMERVDQIIKGSDGKLSRKSLAADLDKNENEVGEWIGGWRSAPNGEKILEIWAWVARHDPKNKTLATKSAAQTANGELCDQEAEQLSKEDK